MSEDLVALARTEHARSYGALLGAAYQMLTLYGTWRDQDGLSDTEIRARVTHAPPVGALAVDVLQQLTDAGVSPEAAAEVAACAAAATAMRRQAGTPEQAEAVLEAVGALADTVAGGGDQAMAVADFREAIVGWGGDGYSEGPLGKPVMVAFDDGTVVPDGVELAGVRETGARHRIVVPQVQAGIDAYLAARADGVEHLAALELAGNAPGVPSAVAQFADDVECSEVDLTAARDAAVASTVADAAIGQFLTLRNAGTDIDEAAATAAGGDPVAVHAITGFVARVRDGFPEDVAEPDAWAAAVAAVRLGEDYRGAIPEGIELPGFDTAHHRARAILDAHTTGAASAELDDLGADAVNRFDRLTRHGMDPVAAARLAAADAAEQQARIRARNEFNVLDAAETVIRDAHDELEPDDDADSAELPAGESASDDELDAAQEEAEQLAFDRTYEVADSAVELFEQYRQDGRNPEDARAEVLAALDDADAEVVGDALDRYRDRRDDGYDHDTACSLAAGDVAEQLSANYITTGRDTADRAAEPEPRAAADDAALADIKGVARVRLHAAFAESDPADQSGEPPSETFRRTVHEQCSAHGVTEEDFYAANPGLRDIAYPLGMPDPDTAVLNAAQDVVTAASQSLVDARPEEERTAEGMEDDARRDDTADAAPTALRLSEAVAESGQAVDAAEAALQHGKDPARNETDEDATRAEQHARWNSEDQAATAADEQTDGWEQ